MTLLGVSLVAGVASYVPEAEAVSAAKVPAPAVQQDETTPGKDFVPAPAEQSKMPDFVPKAPIWPSPGVSRVGAGSVVADGLAKSAAASPVAAAFKTGATKSAAAPAGQLEVLSQADSARLGVPGVVLRLSRTDAQPSTSKARVSVDYSKFADAYGGDWSSRLRLVELDCGSAQACTEKRLLPAGANDLETKTVSAEVDVAPAPPAARAGQASPQLTTLAVTAGASGATGDYAASTLSPSSTWNVGSQTGDFNWNYPLRVPPGTAGPKPELSIGYSSASIDGQVASTNNQTSWVGQGYTLEPGYIERRYISCSQDMTPSSNNKAKTGDLCWKSDNAFLSLGGRSGELFKLSSRPDPSDPAATIDTFRLKNDDGSLIERRYGAANATDGVAKGEHWQLTTTDGTTYFFGVNPNLTNGEKSNSVSTVPVFGNHENEPCHKAAFAESFCTQAWRWSVDKVVDPSKNLMTYQYVQENNYYGRNNNTAVSQYQRASYPWRINYAKRQDANETVTAYPARVVFSVSERCIPKTGVTCADLTAATASDWPDTPFDQICTSSSTCPSRTSPSFFTRKRLTAVDTQILGSDNTYSSVDTWTLTHQFPGADVAPSLWLASITHQGRVGGSVSNPTVSFIGVQMPNRVDVIKDARPAMQKWRVGKINSESGLTTDVTYSVADCPLKRGEADAPTNAKRCFPVYWAIDGAEEPTLDWFHKYVVTSVVADDRVTDAPSQQTLYEYVGTPAWHFDNSEFTRVKNRTWGQWRGYSKVNVRTGPVGNQTQTQYTYFRGMDNDYLDRAGTSRKSVAVTDSRGDTVEDAERYNGFVREQITYNGSGGAEVSKTISTPWTSSTGSAGGYTALLLRTESTVNLTRLSSGNYRITQTSATFNGHGFPTVVDDLGDTATAADDRCTRLTYNPNDDLWLWGSVSREEKVSVACTATPNRPAQVISDIRNYYDNAGSLTAPPTRGLTTKVETMSGWSSGPVYEQRSRMVYDSLGRVVETYDGLDRRTSMVEFTPKAGGPVTAMKTTDAKNFTNTTEISPAWGSSLAEIDANQRRTDLTYDALGRLTAVWLPDRSKADKVTASMIFSYVVPNNAPNVVVTQQLKPDGTYKTSRTLLDGLLRQRQVQTPAANGAGRILMDTRYDERGNVAFSDGPYHDSTSQPSNVLFDANEPNLPARTANTYDGANRNVLSQFIVANNEQSRTTTTYNGDSVTVVPPEGGTTTTTLTDARGHKSELRQYRGRAATGAYDSTKYTYTPDDQLASVTNAAGSVWSFGYDIRGRRIQSDDPDKGTTTSVYDAADRVVSAKDARGQQVFYSYDELDRKTAVRSGSATGPVLASWTYDTLGKGLLTSSTRTVNGNDYVSAVTGYDAMDRPTGTKVVIPETEGELKGTYTSTTAYNPDGSIDYARLPSTPGLPDETINLEYDANGNPQRMGGWQAYVSETTYTAFGEPLQYNVGQRTGKSAYQTFSYENGTRRLSEMKVNREGIAQTDDTFNYTYDDASNVKSVSHKFGTSVDLQCYATDYLRRTTEAWTPAGTCADTRSASTVGGPAPYWQSYTYDVTGNRKTITDHKTAGDTTSTYTYPAATAARPHAVTGVSESGPGGTAVDTYAYDAAGNMSSRQVGGDTDTLTWDAEGHLASVSGPAGDTSFVYDADGNRLIRHDPKGATLYLASAEVRWDTGETQTVGSTRYYDYNGKTIAMRNDASSVEYLMPDPHGTATVSVDGLTATVSRRFMDPYGNPRGTPSPTWEPKARGFVNGVDDPSTGLTHLGAREYDPKLGKFISVDPLVDTADPQTLNAYAYSNGNPATFSDPDGLMFLGGKGEEGTETRGNTSAPDEPNETNPTTNRNNHPDTTPGPSPQQDLSQHQQKRDQAKERVKRVIKDIVKILADELGITDAINCFTNGDIGGCISTGVTILSSLAGGIAGKIIGRYLFKPKKFANLIGNITRLADEAIDAIKGYRKAEDDLKQAASCAIGNSFVPGTLVLLANGETKPIEQLKLGDKVVATDPATGKTSHEPVVRTITGRGPKQLVDIRIMALDRNGAAQAATVTATAGHPFYVPERRDWVDAGELQINQNLAGSVPDQLIRVTGVHLYTQPERVHNLTIRGIHTYYVLAGPTPVLVHNDSCWSSTRNKTSVENAFKHWDKHKTEFPNLNNAKEYVEAGTTFLRSTNKNILTRTRGNGDSVRYNPVTNEFGVMDRSGVPRTYFRPDPADHGHATNMDYFNAQ
ncbi:RHS repeat-associated core domain-containing protein [Kribbella yunnanensis]|uniref:RHS repeat-associated core domain-containing protein n=1 Tax=Kribbella yunnanensis TaxID=190194 RepID=A0ABP4SW21_9ACTN